MTDNSLVVEAVANESSYDYDVIVIGGGSGGLAFSKKASEYGQKVAIFDYVIPTIHGSKWTLGGTCVNVGCIPKKLMHYTGLLHEQFYDAKELGWEFSEPVLNWKKMLNTVNYYVYSLNYGYKQQMANNNVDYRESFATFVDPHTIQFTEYISMHEYICFYSGHYTHKYTTVTKWKRRYLANISYLQLVVDHTCLISQAKIWPSLQMIYFGAKDLQARHYALVHHTSH